MVCENELTLEQEDHILEEGREKDFEEKIKWKK